MPNNRKAFLEITNICNLSCSFCPGTVRAPRTMTEPEFLLLAEKLRPWADYLYFHLMGEPTAHPLLPRFLSDAAALGFRPMLTTNGTLLSRCGETLLSGEAQFYKISISLHAFEANVLDLPFSDYLASCFSFAREAAARGTIAVLRLWNLDGKASGALHERNREILSAMHAAFPGEWTQNRSGFRLAERVFLEWGEKFDWASLSSPVLGTEGFCYGLRDQLGVLCDGTVVPCCLDADGAIPLGNLFREELDNILSSPRAKALYDGFTDHRCTEELCRRCMRAGFYRK